MKLETEMTWKMTVWNRLERNDETGWELGDSSCMGCHTEQMPLGATVPQQQHLGVFRHFDDRLTFFAAHLMTDTKLVKPWEQQKKSRKKNEQHP